MKQPNELRYVIAATVAIALFSLIAPRVMAEEGFMVWGDSQCLSVIDTKSGRNWPQILAENTGYHFLNYCRGGRKLSDGHVADFLRTNEIHRLNQEVHTLLIALGSLDALWGTDPLPALLDIMQEAETRDLRVVCVLPPDNKVMENSYMRSQISAVCPYSIDISQAIGPDDMVDEVHFGKVGHEEYAKAMAFSLFFYAAAEGLL